MEQRQLLWGNWEEIDLHARRIHHSCMVRLNHYIDNRQDTSPVTRLVSLELPSRPDVIIRVIRSICVSSGRYYLGHSPGTYIFQYRPQPADGAGSGEYMGIRGVDQATKENFEFVGQVPRHQQEYRLRLYQLLKPVMTLFISALQLQIGKRHSSMHPELDELLSRPTIESATHFASVWDCWSRYCQQAVPWPNSTTKEAFAHRPIIQELAWLMHRLQNERQCSTTTPPTPLHSLLIAATGESLEILQMRWHVQCKKVAWAKLLSGNRQGLFVYEVAPETTNIFQFYKQDAFANDLFTPRMKHTFPKLKPVRVCEPYAQLITGEANWPSLRNTT
ncbi:ring finger protein [Fusarium austroafricanum]|uniref:Ring finger protein n=1 Tax=Fusarium austroafricanum TaxID=2364996 RepID=A0A8H4JN16_9HYPO|nr:ring finger protein [Fusarium austroafricanum]